MRKKKQSELEDDFLVLGQHPLIKMWRWKRKPCRGVVGVIRCPALTDWLCRLKGNTQSREDDSPLAQRGDQKQSLTYFPAFVGRSVILSRPPARRYSVIIVFIVGTPWKLGYPSRNIKRRTGRCRAAAPRIESTVFFLVPFPTLATFFFLYTILGPYVTTACHNIVQRATRPSSFPSQGQQIA